MFTILNKCIAKSSGNVTLSKIHEKVKSVNFVMIKNTGNLHILIRNDNSIKIQICVCKKTCRETDFIKFLV